MSRARAASFLVVLVAAGTPARAQIYTRLNGNGVVEATNIPDAGDFRLTYPGKGTLIHSRGFQGVYHGEFDHHIEAAASLHSVSTDLVRAVIAVESEFDQLAVSSKGARGLMQLMPVTARRFGVADAFDARQNIFAGVQYLRLLLDLFQGDVALALAAYNAGENAVARFKGIPPYRETRTYVERIQSLLGFGGPAETRAAFFAPVRAAARSSKPTKLVPARPRIYYKWKDEKGSLHVAQTPPSEGVLYTMIRALD
ncbi:MAG TPA: lytic transglycosylase domain-containing protein [Vicinamibacteria bacterium]|nr:lytic transglycosylase domain-containing protein [Vicinamibacteria bacterium]